MRTFVPPYLRLQIYTVGYMRYIMELTDIETNAFVRQPLSSSKDYDQTYHELYQELQAKLKERVE
jgi:hypothetical protein